MKKHNARLVYNHRSICNQFIIPSAVLASSIALGPCAVFAQEAGSQGTDALRNEIIVTATKSSQAENVQDLSLIHISEPTRPY